MYAMQTCNERLPSVALIPYTPIRAHALCASCLHCDQKNDWDLTNTIRKSMQQHQHEHVVHVSYTSLRLTSDTHPTEQKGLLCVADSAIVTVVAT